jgi:uncharacterized membrane protein YphA (DoxX/SURF4 family)
MLLICNINNISRAEHMSKNWSDIGRVFYSVPLFITGLIYVFKPQGTVESLTSFIPGELNLIYFSGSLWIIFSFMIACNICAKHASFGVIGLLLAYQIMVHIPAVYTGEYLNVVWLELLRDISLMGGAFFVIAAEKSSEEFHEEGIEQDDWKVSIDSTM